MEASQYLIMNIKYSIRPCYLMTSVAMETNHLSHSAHRLAKKTVEVLTLLMHVSTACQVKVYKKSIRFLECLGVMNTSGCLQSKLE